MIAVVLSVLLVLSLAANVGVGYVCVRFSRRLLEFDELFELFVRDIQVNTAYLDKLQKSTLLNGSEEVQTMHKNMGIISQRLHEFALRFQEAREAEETKEP